MYLICHNNQYHWTDGVSAQALACLDDGLLEEEGRLLPADRAGFSFQDQLEDLGDGLFRIIRRTINRSGRTRRIKLIVEMTSCFAAEKYAMPCIMYDGNPWGNGNSPKGLTYNGQPWIFAYDRMGIPSCTITENDQTVLALFASDQDAASLRTSASLVPQPDGSFLHRIYYPVTEAPVTYSGKNKMTARGALLVRQ